MTSLRAPSPSGPSSLAEAARGIDRLARNIEGFRIYTVDLPVREEQIVAQLAADRVSGHLRLEIGTLLARLARGLVRIRPDVDGTGSLRIDIRRRRLSWIILHIDGTAQAVWQEGHDFATIDAFAGTRTAR